jgi:hypothetical protein
VRVVSHGPSLEVPRSGFPTRFSARTRSFPQGKGIIPKPANYDLRRVSVPQTADLEGLFTYVTSRGAPNSFNVYP